MTLTNKIEQVQPTDWRNILADMGDAGSRMSQTDAAEGAAGNLSVFVRGLDNVDARWVERGLIVLPVPAPALADGWVVITGAGRRLRDIAPSPETTLCLLHVVHGGAQATLHTAASLRPTSEWNTHLAVHNDHVGRRGLAQHAVLHAQPLRLTFLSHLLPPDFATFNRRLLRWQPETIMEFPEGIGVLPFEVPGSNEQAVATAQALQAQRAVVWQRHGIVTRADSGCGKAGDLVEYAETAARYEYLNLELGEPAIGLSLDELRLICDRLGIAPHVLDTIR